MTQLQNGLLLIKNYNFHYVLWHTQKTHDDKAFILKRDYDHPIK